MDSTLTMALATYPDGVIVASSAGRFTIAQQDGTTRELTMAQARDERFDPSCLPSVLTDNDGRTVVVMPTNTMSVWEIADALSLWAEQNHRGTVLAALEILGYDPATRGPVDPGTDAFVSLSDDNALMDVLGRLMLQLAFTRIDRLT